MNPKKLRIVFLGTPQFAACSLQKLIDGGYNVVAVVTATDKKGGRGNQLLQSAVKILAEKSSIPVLQPEKLKSPEFLEELKAYQPDLMIVVAFRMLPEAVWSLPPMGTFNLHGSLLPQYRGAAPINRAIMNGETKTGVTTFLLRQEIDTGNILFREEIPIGPEETAGELHDKMMVIGADLVLKTVNALAGNAVTPRDQKELLAPGEILKEAPKIFRETCRIDWNSNGKNIVDHVRGLNPFPAAWSTLHNEAEQVDIKIYKCEFIPETHNNKIGTTNEKLEVFVRDGMIAIREIQAPGKKQMATDDFLRGYRLQSGAYFS